jgi:uncharacterized membrane protein
MTSFPATLEEDARLDRGAGVLDRAAATVAPPGQVRDLLRGEPLGHLLHPMLTDLPIGFWTSASVLDLVGGRRSRRAATMLVALGVISAVPTAASGLADFTGLGPARRRVAVVHAVANGTATVLYARSWLARVRGCHGAGVALALCGAAVATLGGYLGGHLAFGSSSDDEPDQTEQTAMVER